MRDEDYQLVEHPRLELHIHVATKFVQFGSLVGLTLVGPLIGAWRGRSLAAAGFGGLRGARIGGVGGILIAPIMTEMAVSGQVTITVLQNVLFYSIVFSSSVFALDVQCNCCSAKCSVLSKPISVGYNWPYQMIVALNVNL